MGIVNKHKKAHHSKNIAEDIGLNTLRATAETQTNTTHNASFLGSMFDKLFSYYVLLVMSLMLLKYFEIIGLNTFLIGLFSVFGLSLILLVSGFIWLAQDDKQTHFDQQAGRN